MSDDQNSTGAPNIAPIILALLWAGTLEWYVAFPVVGLIVTGIVYLVIAGWAYRHRARLVSRGSFWLGIGLFLLATLGGLSFATSPLAQHAIIILTAMVAWIYLDQATHQVAPVLQGRVAMFVMTLTYAAAIVTLLNLRTFVVAPLWFVIGLGTFIGTLVCIIVWLDLEIPFSRFRRVVPWIIWLAAEIMVLAWWLPTSFYVSAVVATTILMLFVNLGRHVWRDTWEPARGRRYILIGGAVLLLVLLTARWF